METADVIVIGGGIMGMSTALDIAQRSKLKVMLIEKTVCGSQASAANFGNIRFYDWSSDLMPIAIRARRVWEALPALLRTDGEFRQTGSVRVTFQQSQLDELATYMDTARGYDFGFRLLHANEAKAHFPWLHGSTGIMLSPRDGTANPRLVSAAFRVAAARAGVTIAENAEVRAAAHANGRFVVETHDGRRFAAEQLLNTAGAWANGISGMFGESMELMVLGPQLGVTEPVRGFVKSMISCFGNFYFRQTERGNLVIGGLGRNYSDTGTSKHSIMPGNMVGIYERLIEVVPSLRGIRLIRTWSGVEGYTPDTIPVIGPSATTPGLFHMFGFNGSGFQLGPGLGEIMSELIRTGASGNSLEAFRIDRPRPSEFDLAIVGSPVAPRHRRVPEGSRLSS